MVHIPNKTGAAGMINDLVVGDAQIAFLNAASSASMIRAGKLKPVAVLAEKRLPDYPDIPTLAEAGYPGCRHAALAEHAGAGADAEAGARNAVQGDHRGGQKEPSCCKRPSSKQLVSVKPNESLAEAQTWLKNELDAWRKTTAEVKIDLSNC